LYSSDIMTVMMKVDVLKSGIAAAGMICFLLSSQAGMSADVPSSLSSLSRTYDAQLKKIQNEKATNTAALRRQLIASLISLEKALQQSGKLEPLLVISKERKRFEQEFKIERKDIVTNPEELSSLQEKYLASLSSIDLSEASKIRTLASQYDRSLLTLQEKLTKEGNLGAAGAAKKERGQISLRPEVTAAEFVLAEAAAQKAQQKPEVPPAPVPAVRPKKEEIAKKKYTGSDRTRLERRFSELCDLILARSWDKAVDYIDPVAVREKGAERIIPGLKLTFLIVQISDRHKMNLKAGNIDVDEDAGTAKVVPKVWGGANWRDLGPTYWTLVEGDWYMSITGAPTKNRQGKIPGSPKRKVLRKNL
jgi:uncharacterized protein YjgD (DUF1641 family)